MSGYFSIAHLIVVVIFNIQQLIFFVFAFAPLCMCIYTSKAMYRALYIQT